MEGVIICTLAQAPRYQVDRYPGRAGIVRPDSIQGNAGRCREIGEVGDSAERIFVCFDPSSAQGPLAAAEIASLADDGERENPEVRTERAIDSEVDESIARDVRARWVAHARGFQMRWLSRTGVSPLTARVDPVACPA